MAGIDASLDQIIAIYDRVRRERPLIHIITNFVTMNDVANATLAIGARPIMAHAVEEVAEVTRAARALVLNLGTPSRERLEAMVTAGKAANGRNIPVIFDPVGIGASLFRTNSALQLLATLRVAIIRGNAGEIADLAGIAGTTSGVDSILARYDRPRVTKALAEKHHAVVVATGATDYASNGTYVASIDNGHPLLKQISGAGDMLDAIIGAAAAVESDALIAASSGLAWFGIAAERAAENAHGIGSFRVALFDALGNLDAETIKRNAKIKLTEDK